MKRSLSIGHLVGVIGLLGGMQWTNAQVRLGKPSAVEAAPAGKPAGSVQTRLKKRTDGAYYVENEVTVCLTEEFAKGISFRNNLRAAADSVGIGALHTGIQDVRGGHSSADAWLQGRAFPQRLRAAERSIPESARCITLFFRMESARRKL